MNISTLLAVTLVAGLASLSPATKFRVIGTETSEFASSRGCPKLVNKCFENMPLSAPIRVGEPISYLVIKLDKDLFDYNEKIKGYGIHYRILPCDQRKYGAWQFEPFSMVSRDERSSRNSLRIEIPSNIRLLDIGKGEGDIGYRWLADALKSQNLCLKINSGNMASFAEVDVINISKAMKLSYR